MAETLTQKDIAEHLGISVTTVSMALRNDIRISEPIREKVHGAAIELGFTPEQTAALQQVAFEELSANKVKLKPFHLAKPQG